MTTQQKQADVSLRMERSFPAPRDRVFRAWTEPAELRKWSAPGPMTVPLAEVDLRVGGKYKIRMEGPDGTAHEVSGTYQVIEPPKKLVYTWGWSSNPDGRETLVTVEFREQNAGTQVVLTHERFLSEEERAQHEQGWTGCLDKLGTVL